MISDISSAGKGFGVQAHRSLHPPKLKAALARASRANRDGKPYLIDEVSKTGSP